MTEQPILVGRWEKVSSTDCDRLYPRVLEFFEGTYRAAKGPGQAFICWDAGIWRTDTPGTVHITTATDELARYTYTLCDDVLTFRDADGCEFSYRRHDL
ncbi:hypothetical protein [Streptomyces sp. NPDC001410]|uniref:hypothetical protein n=1 Tax=Streptomyces sp. NPDC001410 TaxID=3364574 RepID=UPI0036859E2C